MSRGTEAPEVAVELVPASLEANLDSLEAYVTGAVEELSAELERKSRQVLIVPLQED